MTETQRRLLEKYFDAHLPPTWRHGEFLRLDGMQAVEATWSLNDLFRAHWPQITSLPYVARLAGAADNAIESLAFGGGWTAQDPPANVWRVLLERHVQAQMVAMANYAQGNHAVVPIPAELPPGAWQGAVLLFLHYAMKLPFPVADRAAHAWPAAPGGGNLLRH